MTNQVRCARQRIDHFTVVCLVAWPLNETQTGVDLASQLFLCGIIDIRKKGTFLSREGQHQPHFHSKTRQLSTQL